MGGENRQKSGSGFEELPDPDILSGSGSKNVLERRDCLPDFLESDKINRDRSGKIEESRKVEIISILQHFLEKSGKMVVLT